MVGVVVVVAVAVVVVVVVDLLKVFKVSPKQKKGCPRGQLSLVKSRN